MGLECRRLVGPNAVPIRPRCLNFPSFRQDPAPNGRLLGRYSLIYFNSLIYKLQKEVPPLKILSHHLPQSRFSCRRKMAYIPSSSTFCSQDDCSLNESSPPSPRKLWNPDLTTFLAIVQHRQVDFVPRTWQEGLGLVGRGGTAHIGQTHINHEVDFAFKRASQLQQFSQEENAARIYEVFITEILMLTDPGIRGHSNIAKLIGYCWEVTEGNAIYPVIVLEKAKGQNLRQWLESFISSHMSFGDRLEMCIDIASALEAMHHNREFTSGEVGHCPFDRLLT